MHQPQEWEEASPQSSASDCDEASHLTPEKGKKGKSKRSSLEVPEKKGQWSDEEEIELVKRHRDIGNKWATNSKFLPGRSDNGVKNHWNSTLRSKSSARHRTLLWIYANQVEPIAESEDGRAKIFKKAHQEYLAICDGRGSETGGALVTGNLPTLPLAGHGQTSPMDISGALVSGNLPSIPGPGHGQTSPIDISGTLDTGDLPPLPLAGHGQTSPMDISVALVTGDLPLTPRAGHTQNSRSVPHKVYDRLSRRARAEEDSGLLPVIAEARAEDCPLELGTMLCSPVFMGGGTSQAHPFMGGDTSEAQLFMEGGTSEAQPFMGGGTSQAHPLWEWGTSQAQPFMGGGTSQAHPLWEWGTSQAQPFMGGATSQAQPFRGGGHFPGPAKGRRCRGHGGGGHAACGRYSAVQARVPHRSEEQSPLLPTSTFQFRNSDDTPHANVRCAGVNHAQAHGLQT
eukprot:gene510-1920_t